MALSLKGRSLHFVFKIGDRKGSAEFYRKILGMKTLRHEEFSKGCEATCNGPYSGRWSKTMTGYGPESSHFVIELTYNYGIKSYEMGNDFVGITIRSSKVLERAREMKYPIEKLDDKFLLSSPDGHKFYIINEPQPTNKDPVEKVTLTCSNLERTILYWNGILGLKILHKGDKTVALAFNESQCKLEFNEIGKPVEHAKAFGRIAFAVPKASLPEIQSKIEAEKHTVLTPLVSLDTPDKATVSVVILADPDHHEICFVDEEGFSELSKVDEKADASLDKYIRLDKS